MCRLFFCISNNLELEKCNYALSLMTSGGPDGSSEYHDTRVYMGHNRLSILDLDSRSSQPFGYKNSLMLYNGEIYNYLELKEELRINYSATFNTTSDTEVIIKGFEFEGKGFFERLKGMFSIVIYDESKKRIVVVRDTFGVKPLYITATSSYLMFSSELKAFKAFDQQPSRNWEALFRLFGHIPEPFTIYENVYAVSPNSILIYDSETFQLLERHDLQCNRPITKLHPKADDVDKVVLSHGVSDVPISVFFSGGFDSSLIAHIFKHYKNKFYCFSLDFESELLSEEKWRNLIEKEQLFINKNLLISDREVESSFENFLNVMDQPTIDGHNTYLMAEFVHREGFKVALSGAGADELFSGYEHYRFNVVFRLFKLLRGIIFQRKLFNFFLKIFPSNNRYYFLLFNNSAGDYLFLRGVQSIYDVKRYTSISTGDIAEMLDQIDAFYQRSAFRVFRNSNYLNNLDLSYYLKNQLLKDADVFGMAFGVEIRVPFVDLRMSEFATKLNSDFVQNKITIKELYADRLNLNYFNRRKQGFQLPNFSGSDDSRSKVTMEKVLRYFKEII
jgi:asparagine synthase (glutamine-hydrolysing)